jgi:mannan endo-1,4-beta-mannosidase
LWRFTANYLQNEKNIHHLLYSYSTDRFNTEQEYLERYPGDDIIDVLAFDLYDRGPEYADVLKSCAGMVSAMAAAKGKIGAVSEAGGPLDKNTTWWTKTMFPAIKNYNLSYVLVWRNPWNAAGHSAFGPFKGSPDAEDFLKFYDDPKTLFQKEVSKEKLYK